MSIDQTTLKDQQIDFIKGEMITAIICPFIMKKWIAHISLSKLYKFDLNKGNTDKTNPYEHLNTRDIYF